MTTTDKMPMCPGCETNMIDYIESADEGDWLQCSDGCSWCYSPSGKLGINSVEYRAALGRMVACLRANEPMKPSDLIARIRDRVVTARMTLGYAVDGIKREGDRQQDPSVDFGVSFRHMKRSRDCLGAIDSELDLLAIQTNADPVVATTTPECVEIPPEPLSDEPFSVEGELREIEKSCCILDDQEQPWSIQKHQTTWIRHHVSIIRHERESEDFHDRETVNEHSERDAVAVDLLRRLLEGGWADGGAGGIWCRYCQGDRYESNGTFAHQRDCCYVAAKAFVESRDANS